VKGCSENGKKKTATSGRDGPAAYYQRLSFSREYWRKNNNFMGQLKRVNLTWTQTGAEVRKQGMGQGQSHGGKEVGGVVPMTATLVATLENYKLLEAGQ